jgi:hypothetical protein
MDDELIAELLTRRDEDQRVRRQVSRFVRQPEARVPASCQERRRRGSATWLILGIPSGLIPASSYPGLPALAACMTF